MKRFKRTLVIISLSIISLAAVILTFAIAFGIYVYKNIDFESDERLFESSRRWESTSFYASVGEARGRLNENYIPRLIETSGAFKKEIYTLDEISPYIKDGFIAVEDKIFYEHRGVDIKRTLLAAMNFLTKKEKVFGASTITQQVIKNISGDNEVRLTRKLSEIIRASHIEKIYSKDEILEVYLNVIPMSENTFGIGSAAETYFGKSPLALSVAESALLIGLANAPSMYNPYNNPIDSREKRDRVLYVMYSDGIITREEYEAARSEPISLISRERRADRFDSWFVEAVIDEVSCDLSKKYNLSMKAAKLLLLGGGYSVYTTMDPDIQALLDSYFSNTDNFSEKINEGLNYSMVVTDSHTGDLAAIVGRVGEKRGNRLLSHATANHTPGSLLKPLALYAPLIDRGLINYATVFDDTPISFRELDGEYIEYPKNSPAVYDGLISVSDALAYSKNTVALRLLSLFGKEQSFRFLRDELSFDSLVEREVSEDGRILTDIAIAPLALGQLTHGIPLTRLVEAYSVFSSYGLKRKMRSYIAVVDYKGEVILRNDSEEKRVLKETTAEIMNMMLKRVVDVGTAKSITLKNRFEVAGKTGTSGGSRDKLFVGYTPYYTAGVWCGFEYGGGNVVGLTPSVTEVFDKIMTEIHNLRVDEALPRETFSTSGLIYLPYCMDSGERFSEICKYDPRGIRREYGYFTADNLPTQVCRTHVLVAYDTLGKGIATSACPRDGCVAVALIKAPERSFPKNIFITDAEFVYRDRSGYSKISCDESLPYFYYDIPSGEYVGITDRKKQFNSGCTRHSD